ncbi:MAG: hypothetical protein ACRDNS_27290 [Trebonia sp.]
MRSATHWRFMAGYAAEESQRAGLDITVTAVLPAMTPLGDVGLAGVQAYAARVGKTEQDYLAEMATAVMEYGVARTGIAAVRALDQDVVGQAHALPSRRSRAAPAPRRTRHAMPLARSRTCCTKRASRR